MALMWSGGCGFFVNYLHDHDLNQKRFYINIILEIY